MECMSPTSLHFHLQAAFSPQCCMFFCELEAASQRKTPRYFHTLQKLETTKVELMKQLGEGPEVVWPLQLLGTVGLVRALQIDWKLGCPLLAQSETFQGWLQEMSSVGRIFQVTTSFLVGGLEHFVFSIDWEFHHPNWRTLFFRGVGQPPTRYHWWFICYSLMWYSHV